MKPFEIKVSVSEPLNIHFNFSEEVMVQKLVTFSLNKIFLALCGEI